MKLTKKLLLGLPVTFDGDWGSQADMEKDCRKSATSKENSGYTERHGKE